MGRFGTAALCIALAALTLVAYGPVWKNGFVDFDDEYFIANNPQVRQGLSWSGVAWAFTAHYANYWQPLAWLTLQWDAQLSQWLWTSPREAHLVELIHGQTLFWHCGSAMLLFCLLRRMTGATWRSYLVAVLFAIHPMHVESVVWATERKDVLSVFFGILTSWAYVRYVEKPGWARYAAVAVAFALSLMAKPMLMTLPLVLLLLDYWPLRRLLAEPEPLGNGDASDSRRFPDASVPRLVLEKVPLLLLTACEGAITILTRTQSDSIVPLSVIPMSARLANAAAGYGWYLTHTFWPANLAALYLHPGRKWAVLPVVAGLVALLIITALATWQARRRRWLIVGWLWFVGTLVPVIGFAQGGEQSWADRFSYWPHVGLFIITAWGLSELAERWRIPPRVRATAAAACIGALTVLTWIQTGYWRDTFTLWTRATAVTTDNAVAHLHLGYYHLNRGVPEKAAIHFAEAVRIRPDYPEQQAYLGAALLSLGRVAEACEHLQRAVDLDANTEGCWYNLGQARLHLGEPDAAIRCFHKALELHSDPEESRTGQMALTGLGLALLETGRCTEAITAFRDALALDPKQGQAWHGLGKVYLKQGRLDDAFTALSKAVEYGPSPAGALSDLGLALGRQGRWAKAVQAHRQAVKLQDQGGELLEKQTGVAATPDAVPDLVSYCCRLAYSHDHLGAREASERAYAVATRRDPGWPEKFTAKAWKLATDPDANRRDPRLALEMASQAAQASADPPAITLDALAAAHAALGQFPEAVQTAKRALKKASDATDAGRAQSIQSHLNSYEKGEAITDRYP